MTARTGGSDKTIALLHDERPPPQPPLQQQSTRIITVSIIFMLLLLWLLIISDAPRSCDARIYKRCELAHDLLRLGVPLAEVPTWLCIARFESKYNTQAIGRLNGNWSNDWGLFQVSDRYWCVSAPQRKSQNLCKVDCHQLIGDDVRDALQCAQIVRKRQGWQAWAAYTGICRRRLQRAEEADLSECQL